ncbi:hypothetical protein FRC10_002788 [Ceratobasidium sp. 414]|nr:hypothetical protein FRC10_002788 [Ceratobasidium sp. 414]
MSLFASKATKPSANGGPHANKRSVAISQCARIVRPLDELVDELVPGLPGVQFMDSLGGDFGFHVMSIPSETLNADSATLSAYHGLNALSSAKEIHSMLEKSWAESPDLTLRIIWNLRSIHEGQSNRIGFYRAFGWLYKHHPRTALKNLKFLVEGCCTRKIVHKLKIKFDESQPGPSETPRPRRRTKASPIDRQTEEIEIKLPHGCYKDLLNILVLAMQEELTDPSLKEFKSLNVPHERYKKRSLTEFKSIKSAKAEQNERIGVAKAKEMRKAASLEKDNIRAANAKKDRRAKYDSDSTVLKHKLDNDNQFLALYAAVAQIFADQLAKDVELLKAIESASAEEAFMMKFRLSNCSKWAPTLEGFHDRATNIATAVALILFSRGLMPGLPAESSCELGQEKAQTIRSYYRRWFVSPLRRFTEVTEVKMSERQWYSIDYNRVPSRCLSTNKYNLWERGMIKMKNHFKPDPKVGGATLKPHELLVEAMKLDFNTRCALNKLPPLRYEPLPPILYFESPFGDLKFHSLEEATAFANSLGALIDRIKRKIYFSTTIPLQLANLVAQAGASTSGAGAATSTITVPLRIAGPFTPIGTTQAIPLHKYRIEQTKDGRKYLVCGAIRIEIKPRESPPAHEILTREINARDGAGSSTRKRELTQASKEVQKQRENILSRHSTLKQLIECQWSALIGQLGGFGTLDGSLAIVDLNKSMGFPLDENWYKLTPKRKKPVPPCLSAMALGTLLSRLSKLPFKDIILVSKKEPQLMELSDKGLFEASKYIDNGLALKSWTSSEEDNEEGYESVFLKMLLPTAINHRTKPKDMVKRYFIFSDLEFESWTAKETHARIARAFRREEYPVPDIVYWNLQADKPIPAHEDASGCAMVTGFSGNALRLFTEGGEPKYWDGPDRIPRYWNPHDVMNTALRKPWATTECMRRIKPLRFEAEENEQGEEVEEGASGGEGVKGGAKEGEEEEALEVAEGSLGEEEEVTEGGGEVRLDGEGWLEEGEEAEGPGEDRTLGRMKESVK